MARKRKRILDTYPSVLNFFRDERRLRRLAYLHCMQFTLSSVARGVEYVPGRRGEGGGGGGRQNAPSRIDPFPGRIKTLAAILFWPKMCRICVFITYE